MPSSSSDPRPLQVATLIALPPDRVAALESSRFGPFAVRSCEGRDEVLALLAEGACDALILADDARDIATDAAPDIAILVIVAELGDVTVLDWLRRGVQEAMLREELLAPSLPLRLRAAIERKRLERDARTAYATDLETGLPHQQQFIEHTSQLLALREREPAPMAVLVLRVEGLGTTEAQFGREAANALRRKIAVRLRAGVRASDVVASLGDDAFAVLLGAMLAPADAARVAAKLQKTLLEPFTVAGNDVAIAVALGIAQHPQDGAQPEALLRRAVGLAAAAPAQGRAGFANFQEAAGRSPGAANDE